MKLKNYTDIPSETVRAIIRAVCPSGVTGFDVRVSNYGGKGGRGRSYSEGSAYHDTAAPFIVVSIPKKEADARCRRKARKGYLPVVTGGRLEALVFILAHELRHQWQAKVKRGRRVWGARGQFSERDADAYALQMLRRFRRGDMGAL